MGPSGSGARVEPIERVANWAPPVGCALGSRGGRDRDGLLRYLTVLHNATGGDGEPLADACCLAQAATQRPSAAPGSPASGGPRSRVGSRKNRLRTWRSREPLPRCATRSGVEHDMRRFRFGWRKSGANQSGPLRGRGRSVRPTLEDSSPPVALSFRGNSFERLALRPAAVACQVPMQLSSTAPPTECAYAD